MKQYVITKNSQYITTKDTYEQAQMFVLNQKNPEEYSIEELNIKK